jgi:uncharacterized protein (DUF302 family)
MNISTNSLRAILVALAVGLFAATPVWAVSADKNKPVEIETMGQVVLKMPLADGVSMDDAVESLKQRANSLNFKMVGELPLSKQVEAMTGKPQKRITIFEFCDPMTASKMVDADLTFATFLPCRIALVEDKDGKAYLMTLSLDPMIKAAGLSPQLKPLAEKVWDNLLSILQAGANGDL